MLSFTPGPAFDRQPEILCIGAHCDDIEIGCGGTLLALQARYPDCRIHWLVLTSVPERRHEALASVRAFVRPRARGVVMIGELEDTLLPSRLAEVKAQFGACRAQIQPALVFTHRGGDRHQDHDLVNQVTWQTFRDHAILEYEIAKYDGDLTTPNVYLPLPRATAARKIALLMRAFESQRGKPWFQPENFEALMRLRGIECRAPDGLAEGFHCRKLVFGLERSARPAGRKSPASRRRSDAK